MQALYSKPEDRTTWGEGRQSDFEGIVTRHEQVSA
jgi:hypothetical protein